MQLYPPYKYTLGVGVIFHDIVCSSKYYTTISSTTISIAISQSFKNCIIQLLLNLIGRLIRVGEDIWETRWAGPLIERPPNRDKLLFLTFWSIYDRVWISFPLGMHINFCCEVYTTQNLSPFYWLIDPRIL